MGFFAMKVHTGKEFTVAGRCIHDVSLSTMRHNLQHACILPCSLPCPPVYHQGACYVSHPGWRMFHSPHLAVLTGIHWASISAPDNTKVTDPHNSRWLFEIKSYKFETNKQKIVHCVNTSWQTGLIVGKLIGSIIDANYRRGEDGSLSRRWRQGDGCQTQTLPGCGWLKVPNSRTVSHSSCGMQGGRQFTQGHVCTTGSHGGSTLKPKYLLKCSLKKLTIQAKEFKDTFSFMFVIVKANHS